MKQVCVSVCAYMRTMLYLSPCFFIQNGHEAIIYHSSVLLVFAVPHQHFHSCVKNGKRCPHPNTNTHMLSHTHTHTRLPLLVSHLQAVTVCPFSSRSSLTLGAHTDRCGLTADCTFVAVCHWQLYLRKRRSALTEWYPLNMGGVTGGVRRGLSSTSGKRNLIMVFLIK